MSRETREFATRMAGALSKTRQGKLQKAHQDIGQADEIISRVVSVLGDDSKPRRDAAQSLRHLSAILGKVADTVKDAAIETGELGIFTEQQADLVEVALGEFQESDEILKKAMEIIKGAEYDLAHVETFLGAFAEYLSGHAPLVLQALQLMEVPIIQQEATKLTPQRRAELRKALADEPKKIEGAEW